MTKKKVIPKKVREDKDFLLDEEVFIVETGFPSDVRDFEFFRLVEGHRFAALNPIHLLFTEQAVQILDRLGQRQPEIGATFAISRLLVQCLDYSRNIRHLIDEPWDEKDLKGERLFENNRTVLARTCAKHQAERFRLVMEGNQSLETEPEHLYWGTFTTLPHVEDRFDDKELGDFAVQLRDVILEGETIKLGIATNIETMRTRIKQLWKNYFGDFELQTKKRKRRELFKRLMSVAVRQSSTLIWQVAFELINNRWQGDLVLTTAEQKIFEIRYGAFDSLGKINIGFLHDCDSLHADLINQLARQIVGQGEPEIAESKLFQHVQLLSELRELRRYIRADQRRGTRTKYSKGVNQTLVEQAHDENAPSPERSMIANETVSQLKQVLSQLKPRDRTRAQALIDANGDRGIAAAELGLSREKFNSRLKTTRKNARKILDQLEQSND